MEIKFGNVCIESDSLRAAYEAVLGHFEGLDDFKAWALREVERRRMEDEAEYAKPAYPVKERAARAVLAGSRTAYLEAEATARGITRVELAQLIVQKAEAAAIAIDAIDAWVYRTKTAIEAAKTVDAIITALGGEKEKDETLGPGGERTSIEQPDAATDAGRDGIPPRDGGEAGGTVPGAV
jgi:hypothetical protein